MIVIKQWLKCKIIEIIENMGIKNVGLKNKLMKEGKTRWLDVGSSRFDEGFMCLNIGSSENIDLEFVDKYYQADILDLKELDYETLGQFDLVRMQH